MNYYIDPCTGNDENPGSIEFPFKSITKVLSDMEGFIQPGDTIYLKGGRFYETFIPLRLNGTREKPITVTSYQGTAIIDGTVQTLRDPDAWELIDAARSIYRTKKSHKDVFQERIDTLAGGIFAYRGKKYALIAYKSIESILSDFLNSFLLPFHPLGCSEFTGSG